MNEHIIKPLLMMCIMLQTVATQASVDNTLHIGTVEGKPGDEVELQVGLTNSDPLSSVQISIPIDSRLELVEHSAQTTDRTSQHSVTAGVKDGMLNILVYSMNMGNISPGSGSIATVKLRLGNEPSDITLDADKVVMTDSYGTALTDCTATEGHVTIRCAKVAYSTLAIGYGRVPIRSQYQQTVTVSNVGNAPLIINGMEFTAQEFSCREAFPIEIAAGTDRAITLDYAPIERGNVTEEVKLSTNSVYKLNTLKLSAQPFAVNELHVEDASGTADSIVTISLRMNNMDAITGLQLDFQLPEQLEYVDGSFMLSERKADHQTVVNLKDGLLHLLAYSLSDAPFSGNDGKIASFQVKLKGRYGTTLEAAKAILTANIKGELTDVLSDKYGGQIHILSPRLSAVGELDLGRTPITEVAKKSFSVSNYGTAPLRIERIVLSSEHLNVNSQLPIIVQPRENMDIEVTLDDVEERNYEELIQLYTNDPDCRMHNIKVTGNRYSPNYITLNDMEVEPGDTLRIDLDLMNNDVVNGLQFDLKYDANSFEILDRYEWTERTPGFSATNRNMGKGIQRYFCYSLGGSEITKGQGRVMSLLLVVKRNASYGAYPIHVDHILLSTPGLTNKYSDTGNDANIQVIKPVRTVTITESAHGTVDGSGTYDLGSIATLTAIPDEGYSFASWSDGNTDNPRTLTVSNHIQLSALFTANSYKLTYLVEGEKYKTDSIAYGGTIIPETYPTKEGYTFSGWSELPETMPAHDVTVNGSFAINSYKLVYVVNGEEYKTDSITYGAAITPEAFPSKEGHTFSGWSELPETMPAHDVTVYGSFAINTYKFVYVVDGEEYKSDSIAYGAAITSEAFPTKEGHTFSGWSELPETMPAHDVMVYGSFAINYYKLVYIVDGEEYMTDDIKYGVVIIPEAFPTKEGHTFSGWSKLPEAMPAHDVMVYGSFAINSYKLTWLIDGKILLETEMEYGNEIIEPEVPIKDGYEFDGWEEYPETMPDHDITVNGRYKVLTALAKVLTEQGSANVFSSQGILIGKNLTLTDIQKLPKGIYIVNGKAVINK